MSHSSPVQWMASAKWLTLRQQILTSLLSYSGLVVVPEVTTHLKISISPFSLTPPSAPSSAWDVSTDDGDFPHPAIAAIRCAGRRVSSLIGPSQSTHRNRRHRGVMFFLPAFSTSTDGVALPDEHPGSQPLLTPPRSLSQRSFYRPDKYPPLANLEARPGVKLIPFHGFLFGSRVM
jgi:hypothetical protein